MPKIKNLQSKFKGAFAARAGFTLIELLIVIAILGVLAVVVLLALNPVQQLARTRDSGRISGVTQLGHAAEAYATSNNGAYVAEAPGANCAPGNNWIQCLVNAGEIATIPAQVTNTLTLPVCTSNVVNATWCYDATTAAGGTPIVIYSKLEAQANNNRCGLPVAQGGCNIANGSAWAFYSTNMSRGGIACTAAGANPTVAQFGSSGGAPTICVLQ